MKISNGPSCRDDLGNWLNRQGLLGIGAEVGCAWGSFAKIVLSQWIGKQYYMIDPWTVLPIDQYKESQSQTDYDNWRIQCEEMASKDKRITLVNSRSIDSVSRFEDESFDWIYIDAAHDYENVTQDINLWWKKLKIGGLFGGHDFLSRHNGLIEVDRAIEDWAYKNGIEFSVTPCTSWWVLKHLS